MTDQEINITIAEACGFTCIELGPYDGHPFGIEPGETKPFTKVRCPNYCADLNAMHEAEREVNAILYERFLKEAVRLNPIWYATARQRAEAFLRTLGKWKNGGDLK